MTETWQHTHVGRFRVEGVLGRGGMGVVLRAYDPHLQRPVAIKLLTERKAEVKEGTTLNLRERADHDGLLDEARALAQITDPNVLAVYEIGTEHGQTFLVMELVEGMDLRSWLAATPRSLAEILGVLAQAARGLLAAHRRGIIHRDFKPENVLISADGRVRVCDFGIAAFARSNELIHTGTAGTPRYMAPELWRDQGASVQSDVYAFAATLVEAICGELPADPAVIDRELAKRGVGARLRGALARALDPEPARRLATVDDITRAFAPRSRPHWIVAVIAAGVIAVCFAAMTLALHRDDERPGGQCGDAADLVEARWNAHERANVRDGIRRTGATAADADDIVARLDDYAREWQRLRDETCTGAVAPAQRPARLACLDRRLYDLTAVVRALYRTPSRTLAFGRSHSLPDLGSCIEASTVSLPAGPTTRAKIEELTARVIALYDQGLATIGSEGDQQGLTDAREQALALGDIELAVRVDRIRGQLLGNATKLAEAERAFEDGYQLALQHHRDTLAALVLVEGAGISRRRGDVTAADSKLRIAEAYIARSPEATPYTRMMLYRTMADVASDRGDHAGARRALDQAAAALDRMQPRDPLWLAELALQRARLLDREGKLGEAMRVARAAEQELRALGLQGAPDLVEALMELAVLEREHGDIDAALAHDRERVALLRDIYPENAAARVEGEAWLGLALVNAGKAAEARDLLEPLVARIEHTPSLARIRPMALGYLARAYRLLGDFDRARLVVQNAIDDERRQTGARSTSVGFHEISYALLELEANDFERAASHLRVAEDLFAAAPPESIDRLDIADAKIALLLGQGEPAAAERVAGRVLALFEERKIDDARNERFWLGLAAARNLLGRPADARELARRVLDHARERNAPQIERASAEAELALASYLLDPSAAALAELRTRTAALADPRLRIEHARFLRWFAANHLRP